MAGGANPPFLDGPAELRQEPLNRLVLYARHLGWLHAKPEGNAKTRWEQYEAATGKAPPLPPIKAGEYLLQAFLEAGKVSVGFGVQPLTWAEIDAYARLTGEIVEPFEARALRRMSADYIAGKAQGEDPLSIPPWG